MHRQRESPMSGGRGRGMASVSLAFKRRMQPAVPRVFELTNRVCRGHVCDAEDNFALLDLAALLCKPAKPQCSICPIREHCSTVRSCDSTSELGNGEH